MAVQFMNALLGKPARSTGRRRKFDDATKQRVQEDIRVRLRDHKRDHGELPSRKVIMSWTRTFAQVAGVTASRTTLRDVIIRPVLKGLRRRK
jgi:hypothetical protein